VGGAALVVLAMAGPAIAPVAAQSVERQLYVSVVDRDGTPVPGLTADDFIVREDGNRREVLRVGPATTGMQIALLVDTSQAATRAMKEIRDALGEFVTRLLPGNELALITFGERPTIRVDYTSSAEAMRQSIGRLFAMPGSGAYLLDAIDLTLDGIDRRRPARPVIIVVTTEGIEYSHTYYQSILRDLDATATAFHAIVLESEGGTGFDEAARNRRFVIDEGTRASGGRRHNLLTTMALEATLRQVGEDLANQYLVVYARPDTLIPPDTIEVGADDPALTVRGTPVGRADGS